MMNSVLCEAIEGNFLIEFLYEGGTSGLSKLKLWIK